MKNLFQPISEQQFTRSRREIYMSSIGRMMDKDVSCHIDRDRKRVVYERRQSNLVKVLNSLFVKVQRECFGELLRYTGLGINKKSDTIFLPEALLKNDTNAIKSFLEKLSTGQIDRYISLHIPKRAYSQSVTPQNRSKLHETKKTIRTTAKEQFYEQQPKQSKEIGSESTFVENHSNQTYQTSRYYNSKSIEIKKIKEHNYNLGSNTRILEFNISPICEGKAMNNSNANNTNKSHILNKSNNSKSNSNNKRRRDIIHITYKEFNLCGGSSSKNNINNNPKETKNIVNVNKKNLYANKEHHEIALLSSSSTTEYIEQHVSTLDIDVNINEFSLDVMGEDEIKKNSENNYKNSDKNFNKNNLKNNPPEEECESFFSTSENVLKELKENYSLLSPSLQSATNYIGKNRIRGSRVSSIREFDQVYIDY